MWFQANPHEIGPGELPDYELRVAESADGVTWSAPSVFAAPAEGFFDNAVARVADGWLRILARGSNLHNSWTIPAVAERDSHPDDPRRADPRAVHQGSAAAGRPRERTVSPRASRVRTDPPLDSLSRPSGLFDCGLLRSAEEVAQAFRGGAGNALNITADRHELTRGNRRIRGHPRVVLPLGGIPRPT